LFLRSADEERNIEILVSRLRSALDESIALEVIFANDGTTDSTPEILRRLHESDKRQAQAGAQG